MSGGEGRGLGDGGGQAGDGGADETPWVTVGQKKKPSGGGGSNPGGGGPYGRGSPYGGGGSYHGGGGSVGGGNSNRGGRAYYGRGRGRDGSYDGDGRDGRSGGGPNYHGGVTSPSRAQGGGGGGRGYQDSAQGQSRQGYDHQRYSPTRPVKAVASRQAASPNSPGPSGRAISPKDVQLLVNHFIIKFGESTIFQYAIKLDKDVEKLDQDSSGASVKQLSTADHKFANAQLFLKLKQHPHSLAVAYDGKGKLFTFAQLPGSLCPVKVRSQIYNASAELKQEFSLSNLDQQPAPMQVKILQSLDAIVREASSLGKIIIGQIFYTPEPSTASETKHFAIAMVLKA